MTLLSGCATPVSKPQLTIYCPAITSYSQDYNERLAQELEALPPTSTLIEQTITDYIVLRDRIRRCNEEKGKI